MGECITMKNGIKLKNINVHYGKTTLDELLKAGYTVAQEPWDWDNDSKTVMYSFFNDAKYIGQLVFFNAPDTHNSTDLIIRSIDLVLLENEPKKGLLGFLEKLGIKGGKDLALLGAFYTVCWLIIATCNVFADDIIINRIPVPIVYATVALPFALLSFACLFLILNSFFSLMFHRLSFSLFVLFCLMVWLPFTYGITLTIMWLKDGLYHYLIIIIPIVFALIIACWASVNITQYYRFDRGVGFRYLLVHIPLVILILICPIVLDKYFQIHIVNTVFFVFGHSSSLEMFVILLYVQFFIYSSISLYMMGVLITRKLFRKEMF